MRPQRFVRSNNRKYFSSAALSLVEVTGITDPEFALAHLVGELLDMTQLIQPPVPLELLASFQGVVTIEAVNMSYAGRLLALPQREFIIQVKATDPLGRQRFSIAHEISHLLIPNYHLSPVDKVDGLTGEFPVRDEEEYLCDLGARDLLLPKAMFCEQLHTKQPSIENLFSIAKVFGSSVEATAIRTDQLSVWPCVPIIWELSMKPSQQVPKGQRVLLDLDQEIPPEKEFRVKFHAGHHTGIFFAQHRHVPRDSAMVRGCTTTGEFQGQTILPIKDGYAEYYVEARLVPYQNAQGITQDRIISLVFFG
jgi:Zn-dependent peptidase ImmA (M78 family)